MERADSVQHRLSLGDVKGRRLMLSAGLSKGLIVGDFDVS